MAEWLNQGSKDISKDQGILGTPNVTAIKLTGGTLEELTVRMLKMKSPRTTCTRLMLLCVRFELLFVY